MTLFILYFCISHLYLFIYLFFYGNNISISIRCVKCQIFGIWHTKHQYSCFMRCSKSQNFLQYAIVQFHKWNCTVVHCKYFFIICLFTSGLRYLSQFFSLSLSLSLSISSLSSLLKIFAHLSLLPTLTKPKLEPCLSEAASSSIALVANFAASFSTTCHQPRSVVPHATPTTFLHLDLPPSDLS